ncbi:zinc ABC transporter substrate-binding protein [Petroclostridium sp. X23]|uniref:metal ABC transporter solute-binding protein, Zn/Mn family n=1 Tax=Petroclostridium sp. X23 TaxID=3045146 RepID=UPI0024AE8563|nr:zinc ABC transporter substrate-binding protein [Petroclostridium sp. X23]WHH59530.1 zinc ABC transporter substrate-binding protein [Petroclostridium sp. X23]
MKKKSTIVITLVLMLALSFSFITGCSKKNETTASGDAKITVAVTILPQKTLVEAVCGELAEVVAMVPPGNSPGNYEPTPMEMEKFSKASIFFTIGVPTEKANILPKAGSMRVIELHEKVAGKYPDREFAPGKRDPHIWLSPKRAKIMVEVIAQELSSLDEKNKDTYQKNAQNYIQELNKLDENIKTTFEEVKNKKFIVFHPAYGYLADDYGLEMVSLEENGKEATPQHLQEVIDLAKKENIKVIFSQAEIDSKQPEAFAQEIGGNKVLLEPLSPDYIANLKNMAETIAEAMK